MLITIIMPNCGWAEYALKYDFIVDNIFYRYNPDKTSVAVTYNRGNIINREFYELGASYFDEEIIIPEKVTYNDITYPVTKIDKYAFYRCVSTKAIHIPNTITEIGDNAFSFCSGLTEITLPNSIVNLGAAFYSCNLLKEIEIPANVKWIGGFSNCTALETVKLPEGLEIIVDNCFYNCNSLKNISLPSSLTRIDARAFYNCKKIESITIPESVSYIGSQAFSGCSTLNTVDILCDLRQVDISDEGQLTFLNLDKESNRIFEYCGELNIHVTDPNNAIALLYTNAFRREGDWQAGTTPHFYVNNVLMTDFVIPNIGNKIPSSSFLGLTDMKTVTLPQNIKYIGSNAFRGCTALEKINFPEALEIIDDWAFEDCTSLKEIKFGKNIKEMRNETFMNCRAIEKVDIGDLANWCSVSFPRGRKNGSGGVPWDCKTNNPLVYAKKIYLNGHELNELIIPEGVTTINSHVFNNCQRFDKLVIPNSVTSIGAFAFTCCGDLNNIVFKSPVNLESIGSGAFEKCICLASVTLPDRITTLGDSTFYGCTNLVNIKLPAELTKLPAFMFYGCKSLPSIALPETLTTIGTRAFKNCSSLTRIDIPASVDYIGTEAFRDTPALEGVYIKDMAAWCNIKYGDPWGDIDGLVESNPLIRSHNLYLNGELVTDLVIPEGVETIESCAFWGGTCIKSVKFPSTLKTIKDLAFYYTKIRDVMIPNSVESIGEDAFNLYYYLHNNESVKVCLDNLDQWFRNYGLGFCNSANSNHMGAVNLYIKGGNEAIPNENNVPMFDGLMAKKVEDIVVPNSITNIGDYALASLSLNSVILHKGIENISSSSFKDAIVNYVYSQAKFPPSINSGISQVTYLFSYNSPLIAIYVPKGRGDSYKTKWSGHADIIKEADQEVGGVQSVLSISELRSACAAINGAATYFDLTNATLDETVTAEALGAGEDNVLYYLPSGTDVTGDNIVVDGVASNVKLTDGQAINVPSEFTANNVTYSRTLSAGEFSTLCLPYDSPLPTGIRAYSMKAENSSGKLVFKEVASVKANEPYLVEATADVSFISATDVTMQVTPEEMTDGGISGFEFRGTLMPLSHDEAVEIGAYMLDSNKKWIPVADADPSASVVACRAYLVPSEDKAKESISCVFRHLDDVEVPSDVNMDGEVDSNDVVAVVNIIAGMTGDDSVEDADINGDGKTDIADIIALINLLLDK